MNSLGSVRYPPKPMARLVRRWIWWRSQSSEQGLTLLECIAAIVVMAGVGAAIAPAVVLSVATRVQSQRAEQALQLAQGEVDRVRASIERGEIDDIFGDDAKGSRFYVPSTGTDKKATKVDGPTTAVDEGAFDLSTEARLFDIDKDDDDDFAIQIYRTAVTRNASDDADLRFELGVRVYDQRAFDGSTGALDTAEASIGLTASEGERSSQPLATLYTDILLAEQGQSICEFYPDTVDKTDNRGCN